MSWNVASQLDYARFAMLRSARCWLEAALLGGLGSAHGCCSWLLLMAVDLHAMWGTVAAAVLLSSTQAAHTCCQALYTATIQ